jgi:hypothetical protein
MITNNIIIIIITTIVMLEVIMVGIITMVCNNSIRNYYLLSQYYKLLFVYILKVIVYIVLRGTNCYYICKKYSLTTLLVFNLFIHNVLFLLCIIREDLAEFIL